jgi:hypothetical protein
MMMKKNTPTIVADTKYKRYTPPQPYPRRTSDVQKPLQYPTRPYVVRSSNSKILVNKVERGKEEEEEITVVENAKPIQVNYNNYDHRYDYNDGNYRDREVYRGSLIQPVVVTNTTSTHESFAHYSSLDDVNVDAASDIVTELTSWWRRQVSALYPNSDEWKMLPMPSIGTLLNMREAAKKHNVRVEKKLQMAKSLSNSFDKDMEKSFDDKKIASKIQLTMKKIQRLVGHERNDKMRIVTNGCTGQQKQVTFFVRESDRFERPYRGLTKKLPDVFYPDTELDPVKRSAKGEKKRKRKDAKFANQKSTCGSFGKEHGDRVHSEIEIFIKRPKDVPFESVLPDPDPCTLRLIKYLVDKKWVPILSEFPIWNEDMKVATKVDLIVYEATTGRLILLELKTGYEWEEYGPKKSDNKFFPPLTEVTNCPMNMHLLQAAVMDIMLRKKYGFIADEVRVLRAMPKAKCARSYKLPLWCTKKDYRDVIYDAMCN